MSSASIRRGTRSRLPSRATLAAAGPVRAPLPGNPYCKVTPLSGHAAKASLTTQSMNKLNRKGARGQPCCTPNSMRKGWLWLLRTRMRQVVSWCRSASTRTRSSGRPLCSSTTQRAARLTLSKALSRSTKARYSRRCLATASSDRRLRLKIWSLQLRCGLKPHWYSSRRCSPRARSCLLSVRAMTLRSMLTI